MTTAKTLPPFSFDWVGGDIPGLQALDTACDRAAAEITDAGAALSRQVSDVTGAAGWRGAAADAFTTAWDKDSAAGAQLAAAWTQIGSIAATLAASLAALEHDLEEAAWQLEKQGIPVDAATGIAQPDVTAAGNACPAPQTMAARGQLASNYMTYRGTILSQASAARARAARSLQTVTEKMLPPGTDWGQAAYGLDGLRALWAIPTRYRKLLQGQLQGLKQTRGSVEDAMWQRLIAERKTSGNAAKLPKDMVDDGARARLAVTSQEAKIAGAPENATNMAADGDAAGLGLSGLAGSAVKAIPFIGAAAGTGITIAQDRENRESWRHAITDGVLSNGASLGAGAGAMAGTVAAAGFLGAAPAAAVTAGTIAGVAGAVGVGDAVHHLIQENWPQDWHQHGVLDGTAHGVADSLDQTRHDMAHYADDIKNLF